jgi:peptidoglycan hydrolase CwlO-like protein
MKLILKEKDRLDNNIINLVNQINDYEKESTNLEEKIQSSITEIKENESEVKKLEKTLNENVIIFLNFI